MLTLIDTNILLRSIQPASPDRPTALAAVAAVLKSGRKLGISSQTIYEFLAVATRAVADNGLGLTHKDADQGLDQLLAGVEVFYDSAAVAKEARRLVSVQQVVGKKVHDARLAATMSVQGITEILTFNGGDFGRYPGITVLTPAEAAMGRLPAGPASAPSG